jgi:uridine kinase
MKRRQLLSLLADDIVSRKTDSPFLIAVSGITASGKSTLASELYDELVQRGHDVIRASIDNFHQPAAIRHNPAKESWRAYYEDAHNYTAVVRRLLVPLSRGGNRLYQLHSHDLQTDTPVDPELRHASERAFCVMDGTFLLKPALNDFWSYRVFVDTDFPVARARGVQRDQAALGGPEAAEERYKSRYHRACEMYLAEVRPASIAQALVDNNDTEHPELKIL